MPESQWDVLDAGRKAGVLLLERRGWVSELWTRWESAGLLCRNRKLVIRFQKELMWHSRADLADEYAIVTRLENCMKGIIKMLK